MRQESDAAAAADDDDDSMAKIGFAKDKRE